VAGGVLFYRLRAPPPSDWRSGLSFVSDLVRFRKLFYKFGSGRRSRNWTKQGAACGPIRSDYAFKGNRLLKVFLIISITTIIKIKDEVSVLNQLSSTPRGGEWSYSSIIREFGTRRRSLCQLQAPATLPPEKQRPTHIGRETGWAPKPVWELWRGEIIIIIIIIIIIN
jgi:hypothetical protein